MGAVLLVWYLWVLLRDHNAVLLTSFYQVVYSFSMLFSAAIIGTGAHMIEVDQYGTANGTFWVMIIWFVAGMEMTRIGYDLGGCIRLGPEVRQFPPGINKLILLGIIGVTLAMAVYVLVLTGGPLLGGVNRVTFWREMVPFGASILRSLVIQSFFFAAFYFLWQRRTGGGMFRPAVAVIGYVLTALLILGEKFGLFLIFLHAWLMVLPGALPGFRFTSKHFILVAVVAAAIMAYTIATYAMEGRDASFVLTRAALQAQLLWSVFSDPGALSLLPQRPDCYFSCDSFVRGIDYISYQYLSDFLYNYYADRGNTLSGFMPALSIMTFGVVISFVIHLVVSFALGFVQCKTVSSLSNGNMIYGFLLYKVQFSLVIIWFAAQEGPWRGLFLTLGLIFVYRLVFAKWGRRAGESARIRSAGTTA